MQNKPITSVNFLFFMLIYTWLLFSPKCASIPNSLVFQFQSRLVLPCSPTGILALPALLNFYPVESLFNSTGAEDHLIGVECVAYSPGAQAVPPGASSKGIKDLAKISVFIRVNQWLILSIILISHNPNTKHTSFQDAP